MILPAIIAFAAGVYALQQQAVLPALSGAAWLLLAFPLAWLLRKPRWLLPICVLAISAGTGYYYAAARAEWRMSDALPLAWEGSPDAFHPTDLHGGTA